VAGLTNPADSETADADEEVNGLESLENLYMVPEPQPGRKCNSSKFLKKQMKKGKKEIARFFP
jgi:hypothetical protein